MDNLELSPYCLSIVDCSSDDLHNAFLSMVDVGTAIKEGMAAKLVALRKIWQVSSMRCFPQIDGASILLRSGGKLLYAQ